MDLRRFLGGCLGRCWQGAMGWFGPSWARPCLGPADLMSIYGLSTVRARQDGFSRSSIYGNLASVLRSRLLPDAWGWRSMRGICGRDCVKYIFPILFPFRFLLYI